MLQALVALLPLLPAAAAVYLNSSDEYHSGALGPNPVQHFHSSKSTPVEWNFHVFPPSKSHKFVFLTPWGTNTTRPGGYIFDEHGELVWDGSEYGPSMTFTPSTYQGNPVIAHWQGIMPVPGQGRGHNLILDQTYTVVANFTSTILEAGSDFHEYRVTKNDTALVTVYATEAFNASAYGVPSNSSANSIRVCYAQEIDIATGKALFTWRSLDHVQPDESYTTPALTGTTAQNPWDYFHINAIDKDDHGNFLVSSRHCHTIYYIDGRSGKVLWRLGGKKSDFAMGPGAEFQWQHFARFRDNNSISLFDNGGATWPKGGSVMNKTTSRGVLLNLDHGKKTATLALQALPFNHTISVSQGSFDLQPEGTWLAQWGAQPYLSEYSPNGDHLTNGTGVYNTSEGDATASAVNATLLWSAQFGVNLGEVQSYRAQRAKWVGYPKTDPSLALVNGSAYMSWNGATEVAAWQILGGNDTSSTTPLAKVPRTGFETEVRVSAGAKVFQARALDANGTTLGFSSFMNANGSVAAPPTTAQESSASWPASPSFSSAVMGDKTDKSAAVACGTFATVMSALAAVVAAAAIL